MLHGRPQAALGRREVAVLARYAVGRDHLVDRQPGRLPVLRLAHDVVEEPAEVDELGPRHRRRVVPRNDGVDAGDARDRLLQGLAELVGAAVAVGNVDERQPLALEHVAGVHGARFPEHHERVAVGVAAPEVIEVDAVGAVEERHPLGVPGLRQILRVLALEGVAVGHRLAGLARHLGQGVLVHHEAHGVGQLDVAAAVVEVGVGVDDVGDGLVGQLAHGGDDVLAVAVDLRVDEGDAVGGDEDGGVPAAAHALHLRRVPQHVEVVGDLLDREGRPLVLRLVRRPGQGHADCRQDGQVSASSHFSSSRAGRRHIGTIPVRPRSGQRFTRFSAARFDHRRAPRLDDGRCCLTRTRFRSTFT